MPPLRERQEDVPLLTMFFLEKVARKLGRPVAHVTEETMSRLCAYSWPGNIRELHNVIERAFVLSKGPVLKVDGSALFDFPRPQATASAAAKIPTPSPPAAPASCHVSPLVTRLRHSLFA